MNLRRLTIPFLFALLIPVAAEAQIVAGEPPRDPVRVGVEVYGPTDPRTVAVHQQMRETRNDVRHAVAAGEMPKRQGKTLKRQSRRIDSLANRSSRDGLSTSEAHELDMASRALDSLANAPAARPGKANRN
jgi:hypothetical protein